MLAPGRLPQPKMAALLKGQSPWVRTETPSDHQKTKSWITGMHVWTSHYWTTGLRDPHAKLILAQSSDDIKTTSTQLR